MARQRNGLALGVGLRIGCQQDIHRPSGTNRHHPGIVGQVARDRHGAALENEPAGLFIKGCHDGLGIAAGEVRPQPPHPDELLIPAEHGSVRFVGDFPPVQFGSLERGDILRIGHLLAASDKGGEFFPPPRLTACPRPESPSEVKY